MNKNDAFRKLYNYLGSADASYMFGSKRDRIQAMVRMMDKTFQKAENDDIQAEDADFTQALDSVKTMQVIILDSPISKEFADFISTFSLVTTNWNSNFANKDDLAVAINLVSRYVALHLTTTELLEVAKITKDRLQRLLNTGVPAFELSRHYMDSINAKIREGEENWAMRGPKQ